MDKLIEKYTKELAILKENRAKSDEENWSEAEIQECERLIQKVAEFIKDLKSVK